MMGDRDELASGTLRWLEGHNAAVVAAAVAALATTGALDALEQGGTAAELAARTGCDERGLGLALDVMVHAGLAERDGARFRPVTQGCSTAEIGDRMAAVERIVRHGEPARGVDRPDEAGRAYSTVAARIAPLSTAVADAVAARLARRDDGGPARVLDLASGAATFAVAFARAGGVVAALDLPAVVPTTRSALEHAGVLDRVEVIAGDLFAVDLPDRYDVVVLAGFCRLVGGERAATAIGRCARWIAPEGRLVVVDAVDTLDTRARGLAVYALDLATRTETGRPHAYASYATWMVEAGLTDIELATTDRPEVSIISARLPAGGPS